MVNTSGRPNQSPPRPSPPRPPRTCTYTCALSLSLLSSHHPTPTMPPLPPEFLAEEREEEGGEGEEGIGLVVRRC